MAAPIALQLWTIREALAQDYAGTLRNVADMGYRAVEATLLEGERLEQSARILAELGLQVAAVHCHLETVTAGMTAAEAYGCPYVVVAWASPDIMTDLNRLRDLCDGLNTASQAAADRNLTLAYHNHDAEATIYAELDGLTPLQVMQQYLRPAVQFEVDTYWALVGGSDPAALLRELGSRVPLLHIKDGPGVKGEPNVAAGQGVLDFDAIMSASGDHAEWLIVEFDHCATDILTAVDASRLYLIDKGYGHA